MNFGSCRANLRRIQYRGLRQQRGRSTCPQGTDTSGHGCQSGNESLQEQVASG